MRPVTSAPPEYYNRIHTYRGKHWMQPLSYICICVIELPESYRPFTSAPTHCYKPYSHSCWSQVTSPRLIMCEYRLNNKVGTRYWTIRLWGPVQDESAYVGGEDCDR